MPTQKITGLLSSAARYIKKPRIFEAKLRIGVVFNDTNNPILYTTLGAYVPEPRAAQDVPGIFLTMSNGKGAVFSRISEADLDACHEWLLRLRPELLQALAKARILQQKYQEAQDQILRPTHKEQHQNEETQGESPTDTLDPSY